MAVNQSFLGNMSPMPKPVAAPVVPTVARPPSIGSPSIKKDVTPAAKVNTPPATVTPPPSFLSNPAVQATIDNNLNFGGIKPTEDQVNQSVQLRIKEMQKAMGVNIPPVTPPPVVPGSGTTSGATTDATPGASTVTATSAASGSGTPGGTTTAPAVPGSVDYTIDTGYVTAEKDAANAASAQYRADEYAKREAEAISALNEKYSRMRNDAVVRSQNQSGERFSNLAGVGVNPLSSGAANVAGDVTRNLDNEMSNIAMQQAQEIATIKSALRSERNTEAEKALGLAKDTMERIRQTAMDKQSASQQSFKNTIDRAKFLSDEARSNYDFSQTQKADAAKEIEEMFAGSIEAAMNLPADQKALLEKRAGWKVGEYDARIKTYNDKKAKSEAEAARKVQEAKDKEYMDNGYLPVAGPSDLAKLPAGVEIVRGDNGRMYYKPPEKEKLMNVGSGGTIFDPNTNKVVFKAPKATGGGSGSSSTGGSQTPLWGPGGDQVGWTIYNSKTGERRFTDYAGNALSAPPPGSRVGGTSFSGGDDEDGGSAY